MTQIIAKTKKKTKVLLLGIVYGYFQVDAEVVEVRDDRDVLVARRKQLQAS